VKKGNSHQDNPGCAARNITFPYDHLAKEKAVDDKSSLSASVDEERGTKLEGLWIKQGSF